MGYSGCHPSRHKSGLLTNEGRPVAGRVPRQVKTVENANVINIRYIAAVYICWGNDYDERFFFSRRRNDDIAATSCAVAVLSSVCRVDLLSLRCSPVLEADLKIDSKKRISTCTAEGAVRSAEDLDGR